MSLLTESMGADILIPHRGGFAGCQRKEYSDLLASLQDGRLAKELAQMQRLTAAIVIIEGRPKWTNEGRLMAYHDRGWTRKSHFNLLRSIQAKGVWVEITDSLAETILAVQWFEEWLSTEHTSLSRRPGPANRAIWGKASNTEYACHVMQGFEGIGPELAERVVSHFGKLPLAWTVTEKDLVAVPGLGKKKAAKLIAALGDVV